MNSTTDRHPMQVSPRSCPFCLEDNIIPIEEPHGHSMYCTSCFCQGPGASSETGAAILWNRRNGE